MKAVILSAGKGSRISEITRTMPKPMIQFKGKPILEHNIELCKSYGITDLFINTHHLPEVIKDYFGDGSAFGVNIEYSFEPEILGTASGLTNFKSQLKDEPFFVIYGDNFSNFDLMSLNEKIKLSGGMAVIGFHHRDDVSASGVAEFDANGKVLKFIEKPLPGETESHWVNAGIYYLQPDIFDAIPDKYSDFGRDIFPMLLRNDVPIYGVCLDSEVYAFDTPKMLSESLKKNNDFNE
ncbi:MAG: nucleotidyltransferase family protein [Mucilaginibacter sp.]